MQWYKSLLTCFKIQLQPNSIPARFFYSEYFCTAGFDVLPSAEEEKWSGRHVVKSVRAISLEVPEGLYTAVTYWAITAMFYLYEPFLWRSLKVCVQPWLIEQSLGTSVNVSFLTQKVMHNIDNIHINTQLFTLDRNFM